ncbi:hypothetical protein [Spirilliplanes yamanashiensis]|uniref:Uncharacterized protein n=1 Tax=Spirilliplanes yamanashiensis TaxID=42233 RepID=A0A8J3Y2Z2_9ACTN|nr:hypothetical protein [Spirilliplanes yamanashiensis]MDP9814321.1 hypothetical protein [Spirilliplanes yamanashiensis]GIJ00696.1 hypothetical protein Sya03_00480 [Spirilliplanes yamanashiensis]
MPSYLSRATVALAVALTAAVALIVLAPTGDRAPAARTGPVSAAEQWPGATRADIPGSVPDGPSYQPVWFLSATDSIGTAPTPDASALRLLRRAADGTVTELHRVPLSGNPTYGGFTASADTFAFSVSVADGGTTLYALPLAGGAVRRLTGDTGDIVFFNSQYDMVIAEGRLHWVAVAAGDEPATELRSVALTGGAVRTTVQRGAWARAAWPYLVSASNQLGPVQVRNLATNRVTEVATGGTELATCSSAWCRVLVLAGDAPARTDLMRPDGTDRRRVIGGDGNAATVDVAILDRFEIVSAAGSDNGTTSSQQLFVHDLTTKETVQVATGVGVVICRGGILWWSTGDVDDTVWHTLDLRTV